MGGELCANHWQQRQHPLLHYVRKEHALEKFLHRKMNSHNFVKEVQTIWSREMFAAVQAQNPWCFKSSLKSNQKNPFTIDLPIHYTSNYRNTDADQLPLADGK